MNIEDIVDQDSLETWLKERSQEECVWIASRAAARVFPTWGEFCLDPDRNKDDLTVLPVLRCLLISSVAPVSPAKDIVVAADTAYTAVYTPAAYTAAAYAAYSAAYTVAYSAAADIDAAYHAAGAADYAAAATDSDAAWEMVRRDAKALEVQNGLHGRPLWWDEKPYETLWQKLAQTDFTPTGPYDFWRRWYQSLLTPDQTPPMNPMMLYEIARIKPDIWDAGAKAVAEEIKEIEARYGSGRPDAKMLEEAARRTPYGERIEVNPATGKLHVVPDSELPEGIAAYAKRKLAGAVRIFETDQSNQYTGCVPELDMLREVITDPVLLPVEVFDTCSSVIGRMKIRVENGDIPKPEQDPMIADFLKRVREAGADIYAADPTTQEMVAARNEVLGNSVLEEAREEVQKGAAAIAEVSEGALGRDMLPDASIASDPEADPEEKKISGFRLISRVVRIAGIVTGAVVAGVGTLVGIAAGVTALAESTWFMGLLNAALRAIGL